MRIITMWRFEPEKQKTWSWIFLLLQIWPQLKAGQVQSVFNKWPDCLEKAVSNMAGETPVCDCAYRNLYI